MFFVCDVKECSYPHQIVKRAIVDSSDAIRSGKLGSLLVVEGSLNDGQVGSLAEISQVGLA